MRGKRPHVFKLRGVALQHFQLARLVFQHGLHDGGDQSLGELHRLVHLDVSRFRSTSRIPSGGAASRFFRAKRRPERIHLPSAIARRFDVERPRSASGTLLVIDVIHFEKESRFPRTPPASNIGASVSV